jgi:putative transcriptional regulator
MGRVRVGGAATLARLVLCRLGGPAGLVAPGPMTGTEIRKLREAAQMSQAVFARCLNVSGSHVSFLEHGVHAPGGRLLVPLDMIRRKGIAAIL